jgi:hypothetical protein
MGHFFYFSDSIPPFSSCVAIPGLGGHAFGSFTERGGKHMWLRDSLPAVLHGTRVLIYGYDTIIAGSQSFQDLEALASAFRRALGRIRRQPKAIRFPIGATIVPL